MPGTEILDLPGGIEYRDPNRPFAGYDHCRQGERKVTLALQRADVRLGPPLEVLHACPRCFGQVYWWRGLRDELFWARHLRPHQDMLEIFRPREIEPKASVKVSSEEAPF